MAANARSDRGADEAVSDDDKGPRFPWQLAVSVLAWMILGAVLVLASLNSVNSGNADASSVSQIQGQLGDSAAITQNTDHPTAYLVLGLATLLMALLLLIGQGWARFVLALLAVVAMILFAMQGRWEAIIAFVILVVGSGLLLAPSAHRYLAAR